MAEAMTGRQQTKDRLLIKLLFATGLRISTHCTYEKVAKKSKKNHYIIFIT